MCRNVIQGKHFQMKFFLKKKKAFKHGLSHCLGIK